MRICKYCGLDDSVTKFHPNGGLICYKCTNKRQSDRTGKKKRVCKTCHKKESNTVRFPATGSICYKCLYQRHKDYQRKYQQQQYRNDPVFREKELARNRKRRKGYEAYRRSYLQRTKSYRTWLSYKLISSRKTAHAKGYGCNIDLDYLDKLWKRQNGLCALTKVPMTHEFGSLRAISIDRINSDVGYVIGNIQLVCKAINLGKSDRTNKEMKDFIKAIQSHASGL